MKQLNYKKPLIKVFGYISLDVGDTVVLNFNPEDYFVTDFTGSKLQNDIKYPPCMNNEQQTTSNSLQKVHTHTHIHMHRDIILAIWFGMIING